VKTNESNKVTPRRAITDVHQHQKRASSKLSKMKDEDEDLVTAQLKLLKNAKSNILVKGEGNGSG
jgi:metal-responsive CopG/Arc/MetJ family transcriptional regulator